MQKIRYLEENPEVVFHWYEVEKKSRSVVYKGSRVHAHFISIAFRVKPTKFPFAVPDSINKFLLADCREEHSRWNFLGQALPV